MSATDQPTPTDDPWEAPEFEALNLVLGPDEVAAFAEIDPITKRWTGAVGVVTRVSEEGDVVSVGDGLAVPRVLTVRRGTTRVTIDNSDGRPVYEVTVRTTNVNVLRKLRLMPLVEQALGYSLITTRRRSVKRQSSTGGAATFHGDADWYNRVTRQGSLPPGSAGYRSRCCPTLCAQPRRRRYCDGCDGVRRGRDRSGQASAARW